jgi:hypothetical protein
MSAGCEPKHSTLTPEALGSQNGTEKGRSQRLGRPSWIMACMLCALADFPDALLEYIHGHVSFVAGDHQRRTDPNRARSATQE